jgi:DNA-binding FadR family transcriptional regulator
MAMDLSDNLATDLSSRSDPGLAVLPLNRVVRRSAADEVRAQLVALIESGQLQVNDRLPSEAELSRRFGVSRPVVREALGRLQALGLTESRPGSGTFVASSVTKLTMHFGQYSASDLNEVRRYLEVPAARLAAICRTPEDVEKLTSILADHKSAPTVEEVIRFDGLFHCAIASATGNLLFVRLLEDLQETLKEQTLAVSTLRNRGAGAAREHQAVLQAIIARDGDASAAAMEEHLDAVERAIRKLPSDLSGQPDTVTDDDGSRRSSASRARRRPHKAAH